MSLLVCSRCREKEAFAECEVCLDAGSVTKLCGDCFGPHYRLVHGVLANPEEEKTMLEHIKKEMGIGGLTIHDMRKAIKELRDKGEDPYWNLNYQDRMKKLLDNLKGSNYHPNRKSTFAEMHPSVAARDMDSHPHDIPIEKKRNKRTGRSRREADMDVVRKFIRERMRK